MNYEFLESDSDEEGVPYAAVPPQVAGQNAVAIQPALHDGQNPFEYLSELQFHQHFRFSKAGALEVLREVVPYLEVRQSRRNGVLPFMKVLLTIQYLATGNSYWNVGQETRLLPMTAWRHVKDGLDALSKPQLLTKWVRWFSPEEAQRSSIAFARRRGMPMVVGAVDGTHLPIRRPDEYGDAYINRKGWFSVNAMVCCDLDGTIRYFDCSFPGSTHDARIFDESSLPGILTDLKPYCAIGDSAYPCQSQRRFQKAICAARVIIEQTFGRLKMRFQCLSRPWRSSLARLPSAFTASCILHDMAAAYNAQMQDLVALEEAADEEFVQPELVAVDDDAVGADVRQIYISRY
ncbi:hypothetical protein FOL47_006387 [Perkinsus chesapeaki]|uniref:Putative nuclease HARBI1 n=1 Tax=Perkinsus chesapeaki TaxID=330153 RepID=A0A7J6LS70_PERCH|nr:hypothetical protein FOL47_006387 [Perkinsus chesapeaki]